MALAIVYTVKSAQRGKDYFIRRIPGLNAIEEALGRATEMGRPILMCPGLQPLDIVVLQALTIFGYITRTAAQFGNKILLPCADATTYAAAEPIVKESYAQAGRPELFDPDSVSFVSDRQFAYASGVAGMIHRERVAASFMFGYFFAESLIFAESGQQVGAIQVAGTVQTTQIPFFIAAADYTIIGDEYYAASAYISREPTLLGSMIGQDFSKALILFIIILGVLFISIPALGENFIFVKWFKL
jgi:hypothetical protein